jgi:hypothetical protein
MKRSRLVLVIGALAVILVTPGAALADAPTNDLITSATPTTAVPFAVEQDTTEANGDGPRICSNNASVFYSFRPEADVRVQVDTLGSDYDTVLTVLRGPLSDPRLVKCNDDRLGLASAVRFNAQAGVRYILMVASCCGLGRDGGGSLSLSVAPVPTDAFTVSVVPTAGTIDSISGDLQLEGTVDCTHRSAGYLSGSVRQRRDDLYVAQAWFEIAFECTGTGTWTGDVSLEGNVGFAPGDARVRFGYYARDGYSWTDTSGQVEVITLT